MPRLTTCAALVYAASLLPITPRDPDGWPVMKTGGIVDGPRAAAKFCLRQPRECAPSRRYHVAPSRMSDLRAVNAKVNAEIEPVEDIEQHGKSDVWTIPSTRGDCEDFALLKRQKLMAMGWPAGSLLMTVVRRTEVGAGHAVLVVSMPHGDYVLDNETDEVLPWHATGYIFYMRQSTFDPRIWVWVTGRT